MDELKLNKWKENFALEVENLQIEFDSFFMDKKLDSYYNVKVDTQNDSLSLEFTNQTELPKDIVDRITKAFTKTKPEDSI